jgi:hypothetical protein
VAKNIFEPHEMKIHLAQKEGNLIYEYATNAVKTLTKINSYELYIFYTITMNLRTGLRSAFT